MTLAEGMEGDEEEEEEEEEERDLKRSGGGMSLGINGIGYTRVQGDILQKGDRKGGDRE